MGQNTTQIPSPASPIEHVRVSDYSELPEPDAPRIGYVTELREYVIVEFPVGKRYYVDMETYNKIAEAPESVASVQTQSQYVNENVTNTGGSLTQISSDVSVENSNTIFTSTGRWFTDGGSITVSDSQGVIASASVNNFSGVTNLQPEDYDRPPVSDTLTIECNANTDVQYYHENASGGNFNQLNGRLPTDGSGNGVEFTTYDFL